MGPKPAVTKAAAPKAAKPKVKKPARMITKDIGGDKNGGKRTVRVHRMVGYNILKDHLKGVMYCIISTVAFKP